MNCSIDPATSPFAYAATPPRDTSMEFAAFDEPSISGCRPAGAGAAAAGAAAEDEVGDALEVPICTATPAVSTRAPTQAIAIGVTARRGAPAGAAGAGAAAISGARQR